jgi:hypothetical protein
LLSLILNVILWIWGIEVAAGLLMYAWAVCQRSRREARLDAPAGRAVTGSVRPPELAPAVPWITAQSSPRRHSGSQEGVSMRAYLTAAGMALGLVVLWAALVPLLA